MSCRKRGFNWARDDAKRVELSRLAEFAKGFCPTDWDRWFTMSSGNAYTAAERLFFVLHPDRDGDREAAANFLGEQYIDREVQEFVEGALNYLETMDARIKQQA
jgi:hypothetical protein